MPKRDINDNLQTEKIKNGNETGNENIDLKNAIENENEKVQTANDLFNTGGEQTVRIIEEKIDEPAIKEKFIQENENLEKEAVSANDDLRVGLENLDGKGTDNAKMIDVLFREMYPAGDVNLNTEQKTDKITESINTQLLQLPHFLDMENIRYEAAQENVNSLKKDVEMAKTAGVDLSQFPDIDLSIANLDKKVLELKNINVEKQNLAPTSQPDSAQSQEKVIISTKINNNENSNDSEIIESESGPTTIPEIEQFADIEDSESELNLESIKKKIENKEKLSSEEESVLYKMINEVSAKQESEVTETDRNVIKLYFNAFDNNLIRKGEEINSVIDQNTEEIVSFKKKNKEEKDQDINERMEKIKASGINVPKSAEEAQNFMDELEKQIQQKQEEYFKMEQDIQKMREVEGIDEETVRVLENTISSLLDINKHKLHFEYYKYMLSSLKNGNNEELYETHAQQNIIMKMLEDSVGNLEISLERIKSGEEEALREWAKWIKEHPGAGLALLAAAIAAGVLISPYLAKMLAAEGIKDAAAGLAGPAGKAAGLLGAKAIGGLASLGGSVGLAGLFLLLTNSEKIDDAMESIWGKKIPSWAYWGLKKKGAK